MNWLEENWQTVAALALVAVTLGVFVLRLLRRPKRGGCGAGCGCRHPLAANAGRRGEDAPAGEPRTDQGR